MSAFREAETKKRTITLCRRLRGEALASGEIPVCRRLLSPSSEMEENEIADAAEICGRVLAFGSPWSEETWAAVRAAKRSGVPVETFPADGWRDAFVNRVNADIEERGH